MFEVQYEDAQGKKEFCWQTSWGFSTRSIGSMILIHSDNRGLVLPPRVAQWQAVIIPIYEKGNTDFINEHVQKLEAKLKASGIRVTSDLREGHNPGYKFNYWEMKGVPLRIEIGQKDIDKQQVTIVRRDNFKKKFILQSVLDSALHYLLEKIQGQMYDRALAQRQERISEPKNWEDFMKALNKKNLCHVLWCNDQSCEENVKERSKVESLAAMKEGADENEELLTGSAKTLCIPFDQKEVPAGSKCFSGCGKDAKIWVMYGRSY